MKNSKPNEARRGSLLKPRRCHFQVLEPRLPLSAEPIITEFLASNDDGLLDGNGNASDWIEIYNAGDAAIDLEGWYLTDNDAELTQWQFPDVTESELSVGEYLVVFASGDGVPDAQGHLHTNFKLKASGERLALVMPDGATIASQFGLAGADYPEQFSDVSYGYVGDFDPDAAPIQYYDADETPGGNTFGLYGDWIPRGAGAGQGSTAFANEGGVLQAGSAVAEIATTITGLDPSEIYEVYAYFWDDGNNWNIQAGLNSGDLQDFDTGSPNVFAIDASTQVAGSAQLTTGLNVLGQGSDDYSDWVDGNRTLYAALVGETSGANSTMLYVDHDEALSQRTWYDGVGLRPTGKLVDASSAASYLVPTDNSLGTTWTANNFDAAANGFTFGKAAIGYEDNEVGNDDSFKPVIDNPELPSNTTSAYLRTQFNIEDKNAITGLTLDLKYDDGFIAYLNGVEVLSRFAPANAAYNSSALATNRTDADSLQFESFPLNAYKNLLVDGQNTLDFHALNLASSTDFLLSPRLTASSGSTNFSEIRYLTTPTPGGVNGQGVLGFVGDTSFSAERGFYDAPFSLNIVGATPGSQVYYTLDGSLPAPDNPAALPVSGSILVDQTATIRAAAFKTGFEPSHVATETYLFLDDVLTQDPLNNPQYGLSYPSTWQGGYAGDYTIDPRVVTQWDDNNPANPNDFGIREGLKSLPTMSLVLDQKDLWGTGSNGAGGIYPNADKQGTSWRRPASIEYFDPNTGEEFQYNVGVQMQGNASRFNERLLKHSFRLIFNTDFDGPGKLDFPLFDNSDFADINTVSLKASFTDSFATRTQTNRYSPLDSTYMRDVWMRDTQFASGNLAADSTYVQLYINGLYWGLYWPSERIDDAFLASHLGGEREDWDVLRDFNELLSGQRTAFDDMLDLSRQIDAASPNVANNLYQLIQGKLPDGADDPNTEALLDVDNFIDYIVMHLYAGVEDWPSHNWYAARDRVDPGKGFQFFTWDQEIGLDQLYRDRTSADNSNSPGELFQNLRNSSEFRLRFADRVQKLLFNGGALTVEANQARWLQRADQIEAGIIGESARWGDAREGETVTAYSTSGPFGDGQIPAGSQTIPLMTVDKWRESIDYVNDSYFANAGDLLIQRLLNDNLFTSLAAPAFQINGNDQYGGAATTGSSLGITAPGTVYYTTDGSDPRDPGGAAVGDLFTSAVTLNATTVVKARTYSGGQWSPLSAATFTLPSGSLAISEINYHPYDPSTSEFAAGFTDEDDFEFLEVANLSTTDAINLNGVQIAGGVSYVFGNVELAPGERAVVVRDAAAFAERYGSGINVAGEYSGGLSNSGEELLLLDDQGDEIQSVEYADSDPWAITADNDGATLVLDESAPANQLGKYYRWRGSVEFGGTPGSAGAEPAGVAINEVLARTEQPAIDKIELFNSTANDIDVGGWTFSDAGGSLLKYTIPANTILGGGEYLVFDESDFNTGANAFALDGFGDQVYLVNPNGATGLEFVDAVEFGGAFSGESFGRVPNGAGRLAPLSSTTFGAANSAPQIGPLVISEVNYHPTDPTSAAQAAFTALANPSETLVDDDLEFVEIHNPTIAPISLTGWRLRGEGDFDFASGASLDAEGTLVVVTFDPTTDAARLAGFRAQYGIASEVMIVGGLDHHLNNSFARVELEQPDASDPLETAYVTADEVLYDDLAPWDVAADGGGPLPLGTSLNRTSESAYGNFAASWNGSTPTPGTVEFAGDGDFDDDGDTDGFDFLAWQRGFGAPYDAQDLNDWQANYGAGNSSTSATTLAAAMQSPTADTSDYLAYNKLPIHTPVASQARERAFAAIERLPSVESRIRWTDLTPSEQTADGHVDAAIEELFASGAGNLRDRKVQERPQFVEGTLQAGKWRHVLRPTDSAADTFA